MRRMGFASICSFVQIGFLVLSVPGADFWQQRASYNTRAQYSTVFTGTEVIVWGGTAAYPDYDGTRGEGGIYNLANDTWRPTSRINCPMERYLHSAVWTGREMIVWGGTPTADLRDGYKYDPVNDTWTPISMAGAPPLRWNHRAVWTGREMIVWGGEGSPDGNWIYGRSDGGRYDPETDTWLPLAPCPLQGRTEHSAIWTGSEMIIFGGYRIDQASLNEWRWTNFGDGARYNPVNDSWTVITSVGEPAPRSQHTAVWTGSEMIIWGGGIGAGTRPLLTLVAGGASYDPESDSWKELSTKGMPESRIFHTAVWTGEEMIVWGGSTDSDVTWLNTGGRYNPVNKKWRPTRFEGAPEPLLLERAETGVWTGEALFLHAPTYTYGQFSSNFTWLYYPEKPRGGPRHH